MRQPIIQLAVVLAIAGLVIVGCAPAAPAATPTMAVVAPTKAAEPAKAAAPAAAAAVPTAQPTAAPAKKIDFPEKGRPITFIVPWPAGGGTDVGARLLAADLEKVLGTPVQVVNKAGAGGQTGLTEFVKAKPDGYTIGMTNLPSTNTNYLDPRREAVFGRKDFQPLAMHVEDVVGIAVQTDSQFKTVKDVVDYAKANPMKLRAGSTGILITPHIGILLLEKLTGAKFTVVQFDGGAPAATALLGGHLDVGFDTAGSGFPAPLKAGSLRLLGIASKGPNEVWQGATTWESEGYKIYLAATRGVSLPPGAPKEVQQVLAEAIQKAMSTPEHKKKLAETQLLVRYMGPAEFAAYWDEQDSLLKPLVEAEAAKGG